MAKANNLGIPGWFYAGRYGPQRYAYTLQRLTGMPKQLRRPTRVRARLPLATGPWRAASSTRTSWS